ncbi:MAG: metallophosphoesterase [Patescibacteria group bacterium]
MKYLMIVFIVAATVIIIAGHGLLFVSWVKFFHITSHSLKLWLGIALGILSISFLVTILLVHAVETQYTDALYAGASAWLGFVWYAALAVALTWALIGLAKLAQVNLPISTISAILLVIALGVSVYGVWNAFHPVVTRITVRLPNLPETWKGRVAVQLSDIHLGPIHRKSFLDDVLALTKKENPDIVFVTGDLFDGGGADIANLPLAFNTLTPPLGTFFNTGNHEQYLGLEKSLAAIAKTNLRVLRNEIVDADGMQIAGLDYADTPDRTAIQSVLAKRDTTAPLIALYHVPILRDLFQENGVNLQLSGHTHKGQLWPFGIITKWVYQGKDIGLHTDGEYNIYTSTGVGTWGPPMRTGNRPEIVVIRFE